MTDNNKQVLYLSYDGLTDPLGQSQILPYIEGISKEGYTFTIVSFEKPNRFEKLERKIAARCDKSNINWHPLTYTKNPPILSTLYDVDMLKRRVDELHKQKRFKLIHCRSYVPCLVALRMKRKYRIPFIFDMRGFWADERVDGKIWNLKSPIYRAIYRFFKIRERAFLDKADAVVSLTHAGKAEMENWLNENPLFGGSEDYYNYDKVLEFQRKTSVIPCATDTNHFDFNLVSKNKKKWLGAVHGIDTKLEYLGYVGSLGTWYMGKEMIELYAHLLKSKPKLRFLFLSHDDLSGIRTQAEQLQIPQSYIVQVAAERREVPALISLMTASVFFILPAYSKKASSPTKQGELMAMGIPIICNDNVGDTGDIIRKYEAGHVIKNFNKEDFEQIDTHWDMICTSSKASIRRGATDYFSLEKGILAYLNVYDSISS